MIGGYDQMQLADWYGRYMLLIPDIMGEDVKQNASANRAKEWAEYSGSKNTIHQTEEEFWSTLWSHGFRRTLGRIENEMGPEGLKRFKEAVFAKMGDIMQDDGYHQSIGVHISLATKPK